MDTTAENKDGRSVVSITQLSVLTIFNFVCFQLSRLYSKMCCAVLMQ